MTGQHEDHEDLLAAWGAGEASALDLFVALRDPMRRGGRAGIRRILNERPNEDDVDDVVLKAFTTLVEEKGPDAVTRSLVGFARTIAYRRGMDKGRELIRAREQIDDLVWQLERQMLSPDDELAEAERDRLLRVAVECLEVLTSDQRDIIESTVQRLEPLSDWAAARGTTYEAGRRMRQRGLEALRRCVEAKRNAEREEDS